MTIGCYPNIQFSSAILGGMGRASFRGGVLAIAVVAAVEACGGDDGGSIPAAPQEDASVAEDATPVIDAGADTFVLGDTSTPDAARFCSTVVADLCEDFEGTVPPTDW